MEVMVTDDDIVENVESFRAVLSLPPDETLVDIGPNSEAVVEIIDNDRKRTYHLESVIERFVETLHLIVHSCRDYN